MNQLSFLWSCQKNLTQTDTLRWLSAWILDDPQKSSVLIPALTPAAALVSRDLSETRVSQQSRKLALANRQSRENFTVNYPLPIVFGGSFAGAQSPAPDMVTISLQSASSASDFLVSTSCLPIPLEPLSQHITFPVCFRPLPLGLKFDGCCHCFFILEPNGHLDLEGRPHLQTHLDHIISRCLLYPMISQWHSHLRLCIFNA